MCRRFLCGFILILVLVVWEIAQILILEHRQGDLHLLVRVGRTAGLRLRSRLLRSLGDVLLRSLLVLLFRLIHHLVGLRLGGSFIVHEQRGVVDEQRTAAEQTRLLRTDLLLLQRLLRLLLLLLCITASQHAHLLAVQSIFLPLGERLGRHRCQARVRQLRALRVSPARRSYQRLDVLQSHKALVLRALLLAQRRFRLALCTALVYVPLGQGMAVLAATRDCSLLPLLWTVGTLPEPTVALLLDGVQKVLADDLRLRLWALSLLLAKHLLQLVAVPVGVGFLHLRVAAIRVDILLSGTACVERQIVAILALRSLIAASRLKEGAQNGLGVLSKGELQIRERTHQHLRSGDNGLEQFAELLLLLLFRVTHLFCLDINPGQN